MQDLWLVVLGFKAKSPLQNSQGDFMNEIFPRAVSKSQLLLECSCLRG